MVKEDIGNKEFMKKTLLIALIGDPTRYKEVRYKLKDRQIDNCVSFLTHHADHVIIVRFIKYYWSWNKRNKGRKQMHENY